MNSLIVLLIIIHGHTSFSAVPNPRKPGLVIAHRSSSGYLPEHTLAGVALSHGLGADYIEPDLVLSQDGIPVVLHDIYLDTTTNVKAVFPTRKRSDGRWYAIDFTLAEIKSLKVHERTGASNNRAVFSNRFPIKYELFTVPTFEELIQLNAGLNKSRDHQIGLYPELKSPAFHTKHGKNIAKIVVEILQKYEEEIQPNLIFLQCFDPLTLRYIRTELKSKLKLIQLIGENSADGNNADYVQMQSLDGLKDIAKYANGIGPSISHVLKLDRKAGIIVPTKIVDWAHESNLVVHPYTVRNDELPAGVRSMGVLLDLLFVDAKVDGVFTDHPDLVNTYLRK